MKYRGINEGIATIVIYFTIASVISKKMIVSMVTMGNKAKGFTIACQDRVKDCHRGSWVHLQNFELQRNYCSQHIMICII